MKSPKNTEKGQILVLLVLVIIGLLGMTALAIDGSMLYADRRFTQSVADSASLAGGNAIKDEFSKGVINDANFSCTKVATEARLGLGAAINRAKEYYPEIVAPASISDPYSPIQMGLHTFLVSCSSGDKSLIVNVELTSETKTAFIQVVDELIAPNAEKRITRNTVHAETKVVANPSLTGGYAIISLSDDCRNNDGGTWLSGTPNISLHDGGACSNSCMYTGGTSLNITVTCSGLDPEDCPAGTIIDDSINFDPDDGWRNPGNPFVNPTPTPIENDCTDPSKFQKTFDDLVAACATIPNEANSVEVVEPSGQRTFYQGNFTNLSQTNSNEPMNFNPGLYCLSHTGNQPALKINGGTVKATDVTFVILSGDVNVAGNAGDGDEIVLKAPLDIAPADGVIDEAPKVDTGWCVPIGGGTRVKLTNSTSCSPGYEPETQADNEAAPSFLFYVTEWGRDPIFSLLGTSASQYDGIIYAPSSLVTIGGTSSATTATYGTSIIGYDVTVNGGSEVDIIAWDKGVPSVSGWLDFLK